MNVKSVLIGLSSSFAAILLGCVPAAPLPAAQAPAIVGATTAATQSPTETPAPTPDIQATITASVQATIVASPTATPTKIPPTSTIVPSPTPTVIPDTPTPPPTPEPAVPTLGKWDVDTVVDPVDDSIFTVAILEADEGENYLGRKFSLAIGCYKGDINVNLSTYSFFADDYATVTVRLDENPAFSERWTVSGDSNLWVLDGNVSFFINSLTRSQQVIIRVSPYRDPPITAKFDLFGSQAALQQVLDACA